MDAVEEPLCLTVAELRSATAKILDAAEAVFGPSIELGADHRWLVESGGAFDLERDPAIHVGQLSDDLASVREMQGRDDVVLWHDLDHLIGLLTRVSALARP